MSQDSLVAFVRSEPKQSLLLDDFDPRESWILKGMWEVQPLPILLSGQKTTVVTDGKPGKLMFHITYHHTRQLDKSIQITGTTDVKGRLKVSWQAIGFFVTSLRPSKFTRIQNPTSIRISDL
jgi:hypothetical protein